jgi:hypothetical protein
MQHLHIKRAANLKSNYRARTASLRAAPSDAAWDLFLSASAKESRPPLDAVAQPTASFHIRVDMNRVQHRAATRSTARIHQTAAAVNARRAAECVTRSST